MDRGFIAIIQAKVASGANIRTGTSGCIGVSPPWGNRVLAGTPQIRQHREERLLLLFELQ
jgi:hypothetical protein